jgi:8-oxo-dGTP diphosphatase
MSNIPKNAVKAVIKNHAGEILFLQSNPSTRASIYWDLPGGLIDEGESQREALSREIREELGAVATIGKQLGTWSFHRPLDGAIVAVTNYEAIVENEDTLALSDEHADKRWVAVEDISSLDIKDSSLLAAFEKPAE